MGRPATGWRTLPSLERMRLPKPAAMIIAPRFFIQSCPAYFLRRQYRSCINFKMKQDAQKCPPTRPQAKKKPEAYPLGYVEDFFEPRTKLEAFFSILTRLM